MFLALKAYSLPAEKAYELGKRVLEYFIFYLPNSVQKKIPNNNIENKHWKVQKNRFWQSLITSIKYVFDAHYQIFLKSNLFQNSLTLK